MPHVYVVREPFDGFEKGAVISHEQAHRDPSRLLDHHAVRVWRDDPEPAAVIVTGNADPAPQPDAVIVTGNGQPVSPPPPADPDAVITSGNSEPTSPPPPAEPPPLSPPAAA
jgi:hypothetical protein